jgi:hypothetical protein
MTRDRYNGERGSVLVMAVVMSFISILLGVTFLTFAVTLHNDITNQIADKQALYDAHAGIMMAIADQQDGNNFHEGLRNFYDQNLAGYTVISRGHQEEGMTSATQYKFLGQGRSLLENGTMTRQITADFSDESYADYLYISSRERDSLRHVIINFWTPDTLDGKVHSNDTIHIQPEPPNDAPLFLKRVTSTRNAFVPQGNHARFAGTKGYSGKIIFPDQAEEIRYYNGLRDLGWGTGNAHDSLTQLTLSGSNIYMRKCGLYHINGRDSLRCDPPTIDGGVCVPIPASGCVFVPGKVLITASRGRGDLMDGQFPERPTGQNFISLGFSGQLTIASSDTMILGDNIIYQHSRPSNAAFPNSPPPTLDSCRDVLGLISERYIMIGRQVRDTVYINAALAAVVGSISVQDIYWQTPPQNQNPKQSLVIWGSLAQRNRGIVHTTDYPPGTERGFDEKDYHYDWRLKVSPPPHFLRTLRVNTQFYEPLFDNASDQGGG